MSRRRIMDNVEDSNIVNGYEFVDLGLSVNWATCNIGAESPEEYGWYFQWAGIIPYNTDRTPVSGGKAIEFNWNSNCPYWKSGTSTSELELSKYNTSSSYGTAVDKRTVLEPEDDAAHVHIGEECRMPTEDECKELINACNTTWVTDYNGTGVSGKLFTLKSDPSKTLFFPASGYLYHMSLNNAGSSGSYWSSSLNTSGPYFSRYLGFTSGGTSISSYYRYSGLPIRAVKPKNN